MTEYRLDINMYQIQLSEPNSSNFDRIRTEKILCLHVAMEFVDLGEN